MNSKQIVAALSVVLLVVILVYPALSSGRISIAIGGLKINDADHIYVTVYSVWIHVKGESSDAGWKSILNRSQTVDLVSLENRTEPLVTSQISAEQFDAVRLSISNVTWVFNKTTTTLLTASPNIDSNLEFTLTAAKGLNLTILLGGQQEVIGASKFFQTTMTVTATEAS